MRYSVFSGTNTAAEAWLALRGIFGGAADGPEVAEFERRFAEATGTTDAVSFATGRMGLYAILEALGVGPGDEVIVPAFTCVVVPNAVIYRGARPIYADIDPGTYNVSPASVAAAITPRTRVIIAQHTFGLACDVAALKALAAEHSIAIVEDCAHALGSRLEDKPVGSFGVAGYFSIDHTKMIGTGTGGVVTTSDAQLAARLREIQRSSPFPPGWKVRLGMLQFALEVLMTHPAVYRFTRFPYKVLWRLGLRRAFYLDELEVARPTKYPYPARLSRAHARLGLSQLDGLAKNLAWRQKVAGVYDDLLSPFIGRRLGDSGASHSFLRYTLTVKDRTPIERHLAPVLEMATWFDSVVQGRRSGLDEVGYEAGSCPVGEDAAKRCVNLPTHPRVARPEVLAARLAGFLDAVEPDQVASARLSRGGKTVG